MIDKNLNTIRNILVFFTGIIVLILMWLLQDIIIPFVLASFLALLLQPILDWLNKKKVPIWAGVGIIWILFTACIIGLFYIFYNTGQNIYEQKQFFIDQLKIKGDTLLAIYQKFTGKELDLDATVEGLIQKASSDFLVHNSGSIFGTLGTLTEEFLLTIVYLVVLLSGIMKYESYLNYLGGESSGIKYLKAFEEVKTSVASYVKVKFFISLLYGISTFIICYLFDLRFAFFWGFLSFILNFLPVIGAIIALIPIAIMGLIQFSTIGMVLILVFVVYSMHFLLATGLEPFFMGKKTSLNIVVIIMGLLFWGFLWGIFGMFLSVPLMVLTKVVLSQITGAELFVKLLGTKTTEEN